MPYPILLGLAVIIFSWIAWRDIRHGLFLITVFLPAYLLRFEILGVPMTFLEVMILIVLLVSVFQRQPGKGDTNTIPPLTKGGLRGGLSIPMILLLLAATLGVFIAPDKLAALGIWKAYFVEPILIFFIIVTTIKTKRDTELLLISLGAGALLVSLFAIFQYATDLAIPIPWDVERRVTSVFPYPNAVGLYLGPIIVLGLISVYSSFILRTKSEGSPGISGGAGSGFAGLRSAQDGNILFWIFTIILSFIALILAKSEAAIGAVLVTILLSCLFVHRLRRIAIVVAALAVLVTALIPSWRDPIVRKITFQDTSGQTRLVQWKETLPLLADRSFFGAGLSGYPSALAPYHARTDIEIFQYPHNIVLNIWTELGLLGVLAVAWLGWKLVALSPLHKGGLQGGLWEVAVKNGLALCSLAALFAMSLHGLVDVPYFKNDLAILTWILIAIVVNEIQKEKVPDGTL